MRKELLLIAIISNSAFIQAEAYTHYNWQCLTCQNSVVSSKDIIENKNYELKTFQSNGSKALPAYCVGKQQDRNYNININNNGGQGGTLIYNNDGSMSISTPSKTGHTFNGWQTSDNNAPANKIPNWYAGDLSYTAQWTANLYWTDLNGYFNSGSYDHLEHATAKIYINGQYLDQLSDFCRQLPYGTKYKFEIIPELGYEVDKTVWEGTVEGDTRIWTTISPKTYTITFDTNGGTGGPNTQYFKWNSGEKISTTIPSRDGYTFKGWEIHDNQGVIGTLQAGDNIPVAWGSFKAVAIWKENIEPWSKVIEKNNYRVTYNTWTDVDYTIEKGITVNKIYCDAQVYKHTSPGEEEAYVYPEIYVNGSVVARGSKKEGNSWQWTSSTTETNGTWYSGTHIMGRSSGGTRYASNDFYRYVKCTLSGTKKG